MIKKMSQGAPEVADNDNPTVRDIIDEWIYSGGEVEEDEEDIDFQVQLDLAERLDTNYQEYHNNKISHFSKNKYLFSCIKAQLLG